MFIIFKITQKFGIHLFCLVNCGNMVEPQKRGEPYILALMNEISLCSPRQGWMVLFFGIKTIVLFQIENASGGAGFSKKLSFGEMFRKLKGFWKEMICFLTKKVIV